MPHNVTTEPRQDGRASDIDEAIIEEEFKFFCRHFIGFAYLAQSFDRLGRPVAPATPRFHSGFAVSLSDQWYLMTAGHILRDIERQVATGRCSVEGFRLLDYFGSGQSKEPVPFNYDDARKAFCTDDTLGLDYGVITIDTYHRRLLEANGIVPVTRVHWTDEAAVDATMHFMLGLPEDSIESFVSRKQAFGRATPSVVALTRLKRRPAGSPKTLYPRFYGRIEKRHDHNVGSIRGISGGPIFAVDPDNRRYWVVAVQSSWWKRRYTFGCPLAVCMEFLVRQELAQE